MNPFRNTARICLELSNLCNYSWLHLKCPTSQQREHEILPSKIVTQDVLHTLKYYGYNKEICFHNYNEPLIDPRLMSFLYATAYQCPEAIPFLWTNGSYLNQTLAVELEQAGLKKITISAYSEAEYDRLSKLHFVCESTVVRYHSLDDVLNIYNHGTENCHNPCFAPLGDIIIHSDGRMGLCCLDWDRRHTFGDLMKEKFADIVSKPEVRAVYDELRKGHRQLDICTRCTRISCGGSLRDL
jgi:2-deoxy-scyllo-inosamine dehydrogenase (SAM-dependent)